MNGDRENRKLRERVMKFSSADLRNDDVGCRGPELVNLMKRFVNVSFERERERGRSLNLVHEAPLKGRIGIT